MKSIEKKVDNIISPHKKRSRRHIGMRKRTAIGIFVVLGIALSLTAGAALLTYYGQVKTTADISQSVMLNDGSGSGWQDYSHPITFSFESPAGCTVCKDMYIKNFGCIRAAVNVDAMKSVTGGNSDGIYVCVNNVTDPSDVKEIGDAMILEPNYLYHLQICYQFDSALVPATYVITTKFSPRNIGTMVFQGTLNSDGDGTLAMVNESQPGAPGDGEAGFDVYAKNCAIAMYDTAGTGPEIYAHGPVSGHDAYAAAGGWGPWSDPDCADWYNYQLRIHGDTWYLEYNAGAGATADPMSGTLNTGHTYAFETGVGAYYTGMGAPEHPNYALNNPYTGVNTGAQAWDMDWSWGSEYIPLEYPGFTVEITTSGGISTVVLTPAAAPSP